MRRARACVLIALCRDRWALCRVVEFERDTSNDEYSGNHKVGVELWDVAGDHK